MDRELAAKLIEENLNIIFAWSLSKVYDKSQAEDLAQDVICEVLKSVHRLECDEAFFGFMWRIAENTFNSMLRKKRETVELDDDYCGAYWNVPESEVIKSEQIQMLRRELSLLSYYYRESTVRYYIQGKSCARISSELNISTEMVKYYLFKTRKIMKEGIGMTREYGEKSYNPQMFRVDFWGGNSYPYFELFKRRLPGNIVLSAYDKPVTVTELSMELGVSTVYLEDEIGILMKHDLMKKVGDKYQTNIIIFTDEYQKRVIEKFRPVYEKTAESIYDKLMEHMEELKKYCIYEALDENGLKWAYVNFVLYNAWLKADELGNEKYGPYPQLSNGSYGFVYGFDNDYENHHFNGIYGHLENKDKTAWVTVLNYMAIEKCQHWKPYNWEKSFSAMVDGVIGKDAQEAVKDNEEIIRYIEEGYLMVENGKVKPQFPVFTTDIYEKVKELLAPLIDEAYESIVEICDIAEEVLSDYVPSQLKDRCGRMAQIQHQMDVMGYIVESMILAGKLSVPDKKSNIGIFGVKTSDVNTSGEIYYCISKNTGI